MDMIMISQPAEHVAKLTREMQELVVAEIAKDNPPPQS
jgi:hypothetical protein